MSFKLLKILHDEVNTNLLKGKLESEGLIVKLNSSKVGGSYYSAAPNTFGIYVDEKEFIKAQQIVASFAFNEIPNSKFSKVRKTYSFGVWFFLLVISLFMIYQAVSDIFLQNNSYLSK